MSKCLEICTTLDDLYIKLIMPSDIISDTSIVNHCYSTFLRAIHIFLPLERKKEDEYFNRRKIC